MEFPHGIWNDPLWKLAARAGLRRISQMVSGGNLAGASRLATTPGVLKPNAAGSAIKTLGRGAEGVADLVAHPQHGISVRKTYDPVGISGSEIIGRKEQAGRAIGINPSVAQFHGSAPTPHGQGTMHFSEYVSGQGPKPAPTAGSPQEQRAISRTQNQTQMAMRGAGFAGAKDVRKANMAWDANAGNFKTIDYIPHHQGEFFQADKGGRILRDRSSGDMARMPRGVRDPQQVLSTTEQAGNVWNPAYNPMAKKTLDPRQSLLGGRQQAAGATPAPISAAATAASPRPRPAVTSAPPAASAKTMPSRPSAMPSAPIKPIQAQVPSLSTNPIRPLPLEQSNATKPLRAVG